MSRNYELISKKTGKTIRRLGKCEYTHQAFELAGLWLHLNPNWSYKDLEIHDDEGNVFSWYDWSTYRAGGATWP